MTKFETLKKYIYDFTYGESYYLDSFKKRLLSAIQYENVEFLELTNGMTIGVNKKTVDCDSNIYKENDELLVSINYVIYHEDLVCFCIISVDKNNNIRSYQIEREFKELRTKKNIYNFILKTLEEI